MIPIITVITLISTGMIPTVTGMISIMLAGFRSLPISMIPIVTDIIPIVTGMISIVTRMILIVTRMISTVIRMNQAAALRYRPRFLLEIRRNFDLLFKSSDLFGRC